ncbi:MAG: hypothetical protein ACOYU2_06110 [Nitrospirota bacterium]
MEKNYFIEMATEVIKGQRTLDEFKGKTRLAIEATIAKIQTEEVKAE